MNNPDQIQTYHKEFKDVLSTKERITLCKDVREKHPGRIPIIVQPRNKDAKYQLKKYKFLCPEELTFGQFVYTIRRRLSGLRHEHALFVSINNTLQCNSSIVMDIYEKHKDDDGFLYVTYSEENTFG